MYIYIFHFYDKLVCNDLLSVNKISVLLIQAFTVEGVERMAAKRDRRTLHAGPICLCYMTYLRTKFSIKYMVALSV